MKYLGTMVNDEDLVNKGYVDAQVAQAGGSVAKGTIVLDDASWVQHLNLYYMQSVTVTGATVTANSKIDLQLNPAQIAALTEGGVTGLVIENNNESLIAYAFGKAPDWADFTIQCTVTEAITSVTP